MLHHDGKLRTLITLAKRGYRLPRVFEAVTIETMMDGNAVERFDPSEFRKFVNKARGEQNLRSLASRAVRAAKRELVAGRNDIGNGRLAHQDGFVAGEFFPRLNQKRGRRTPFPSKKAMNCGGAQIALTPRIAEQNPAVASSENECGA